MINGQPENISEEDTSKYDTHLYMEEIAKENISGAFLENQYVESMLEIQKASIVQDQTNSKWPAILLVHCYLQNQENEYSAINNKKPALEISAVN